MGGGYEIPLDDGRATTGPYPLSVDPKSLFDTYTLSDDRLIEPRHSDTSHHHHHHHPPSYSSSASPYTPPMQATGLVGSPGSMHAPLPRRSSDRQIPAVGSFDSSPDGFGPDGSADPSSSFLTPSGDLEEATKKRKKRASLPIMHNSPAPSSSSLGVAGPSSSGLFSPALGGQRAMTVGHSALPAGQNGIGSEDEDGQMGRAKGRSPNHGGLPNLTSCEACRKGKRRCEPSPLVPPNHPDIAKLPCARCRRFALECVRVRMTRRKGPAPVDLSAISDAVHGYATTSTAQRSGDIPSAPPDQGGELRRTSSVPAPGSDQADLAHPRSAFTSPAYPILSVSPSLSISAASYESLDQVVSGYVIDTIINLFFDYVYPLTPCLHRPTFVANLTARRDKTDPVFFALALTVIASTLVQVPRSLVNLDKAEVENLARQCIRVARAKISYIFEEPGPVYSTYIVISYLEGIVHLFLGNNTAHVVATAQANQFALAMRLNEENSYDGLDPIEAEIRRRIYWLLFQADKSTACLRARTICLRLEDAAGLRLPAEVDDELITPNGIVPQPMGKTPLIAGFNVNTNLFRILNDALVLQRRRTPHTIDSVLADLRLVDELHQRVMRTTLEVPDALLLRMAYDSRGSSPANDWEVKLHERFLNYFRAPEESAHAWNSFLVMQGNILVTQHLVRLVLLQTREQLSNQLGLLTQMPVQNMVELVGSVAPEAAEDIARELLDGLNSLPIECVATNGPSLVQKVRFVAIQLMEYTASPSPSTERGQRLLMQFLSVLSVIEGMYTFGRDISAE